MTDRTATCAGCGGDHVVSGRIVSRDEPGFLPSFAIRSIGMGTELRLCLECGLLWTTVDTDSERFRLWRGDRPWMPGPGEHAPFECGRCGYVSLEQRGLRNCPRCGLPSDTSEPKTLHEVQCAHCHEDVPLNFSACWNCGATLEAD